MKRKKRDRLSLTERFVAVLEFGCEEGLDEGQPRPNVEPVPRLDGCIEDEELRAIAHGWGGDEVE